MKISTKGRYGLRAMLDLALNSNGSHVSLFNIAERQAISVNYLEQVFSQLRKAGLVNSVKGAQGGYTLADKPGKIGVGAILRCLEGELSVADEDTPQNSSTDNPLLECLQTQVWDRVNESVNRVVDGITLQDLMDSYRSSHTEPMFFI